MDFLQAIGRALVNKGRGQTSGNFLDEMYTGPGPQKGTQMAIGATNVRPPVSTADAVRMRPLGNTGTRNNGQGFSPSQGTRLDAWANGAGSSMARGADNMGGSKPPKDNSAEVARIEAQSQQQAQAAQQTKQQADQAAFDARMNGAFGSGISSAEDYFRQRGLDPAQYMSSINTKANQLRSSVPNLAGDPGSYFSGLGEQVFGNLQEGARGTALRGVNQVAPQGFATKRIADTADDDAIAAILGEQRGTADSYLNNLKGRGVITNSGYSSALKNLDQQALTGKARLSEIGGGVLNAGRTGAENLANEGRTRASNLNLGEQYDPFTELQGGLGSYFNTFFSGLGDKLRTAAPANLFDTSGLANVAGAAAGAQNTPFNPAAIAGNTFGDEDEEDTFLNSNPF